MHHQRHGVLACEGVKSSIAGTSGDQTVPDGGLRRARREAAAQRWQRIIGELHAVRHHFLPGHGH